MEESDLNRIIVSSINSIGMAHKISDEAIQYTSTSKKPFDYFGITDNYIIYGESKLLKGYQSFNFKRIRDHQFKYLNLISKKAKNLDASYILPVISLGIWESHKYFHIYFFHIDYINYLKSIGKNSLKKKDLLKLYDKSCYIEIKKQEAQGIESLQSKIIREIEI